MHKTRVLLAATLLVCHETNAAVTVPRWFGDGMVFQINSEYGSRAFLNGRARPGEKVTVTFNGGKVFPAVADTDGNWEVEFNRAGVGSGPGNVTVSGEDGPSITATNVMGGDVYFCSGQSNMVFPMKFAYNPQEEMATLSKYPNFRFFVTGRDTADSPQFDLSPTPAGCDAPPCNTWLTAKEAAANNNNFLANFSAVCFMTVRDIARMHSGDRPVALIQSAWGGTRVEAWMSTESIAKAVPTAGATPPVKPAQNNASVLYNAMVAPWSKFSVRAAFWYQGEANADQKIPGVDQTQYYAAMYQEMIADWRDKKGMGDFAFMTVQLPPSVPSVDDPSKEMETGRMQIRLAEAEASPHTNGLTDISGVAVALDCGGKSAWGWDHPPNKNEISRRLALQTVHAAFAVQGEIPNGRVCPTPAGSCNTSSLWTGPVLAEATIADGAVEVKYAGWSAVGLRLKDVLSTNPDGTTNNCSARPALPSCCSGMPPFELMEAGEWVRVAPSRTSVVGPTVTLRPSAAGVVPTQVRFAWADYVDCILVNSDDLPAGPFVLNLTDATEVKAAPVEQPKATGLIQSPPMGTNTWNFYHCNIDENIIKSLADHFISSGMAKAGYEYINIDDCWQVERLPNGTIVADPARFPSGMRALADYVHSKGLKFGLYTARGSGTCQGRPGSLNHELIDAATYCDWNLDYIKIDKCQGAEDEQTSWTRFHQGLTECYQKTGREIVQSVESCDDPSGCGQFVTTVANLWRTGGDVQNYWGSIMSNIHVNDIMADIAVPGHFNDPDMLQVGNVGLTPTEQVSHFSLWCIVSAPLLAGTDITHIASSTLEILTAPELIEINQDLGVNGRIQGKHVGPATLVEARPAAGPPPPTSELWVKPLSDGKRTAVLLLNLDDDNAADLSFTPAMINATYSSMSVRDAWKQSDLGKFSGSFTAKAVPSHGVVVVTVTNADSDERK